MSRIQLTLAIGDYDHVRDLASGRVIPEGIELTCLTLSVEETFYRFLRFREWDVSEMSFGKYVSLLSQDDRSLTAIPVFPSRVFRQSSIYVRRDGRVKEAGDLKGARVGVPEWSQTAAIYSRGYLTHDVGIRLADIYWVQAGVNEPGRTEKVALRLPEGVRCEAVPARSLNEMLLAGDLDAVLSARPPLAFTGGDGAVVRLWRNAREVEQDYFAKTGIFPIMHVVALRAEVLERHPWVAANLLRAFEEAKQRSLARVRDITASHVPLPWLAARSEEAEAVFGRDFWPYGMEPNRPTLEAFLQFAHEQGVCHRRLQVEDLFPASVQSTHRV